ncbi:hypothetical protein [Streptomyces sp. 6N223]|uniref:hypothetical protein n=1 Tax=Streptomyces sp. 6N223 TaxID=3457412 RepID=UPI003FD46D59
MPARTALARTSLTASVVPMLLVPGACSQSGSEPGEQPEEDTSSGEPPAGLERLCERELAFESSADRATTPGEEELHPTNEAFEPLDHEAPAARRRGSRCCAPPPAASRWGRRVINPGGPGGPGLFQAATMNGASGPVAERCDLVGFDPRGAGL